MAEEHLANARDYGRAGQYAFALIEADQALAVAPGYADAVSVRRAVAAAQANAQATATEASRRAAAQAATPVRSSAPGTSESSPARRAAGSSVLTASNQNGLLGVPLPEGAQLTQRTPGDPALLRDPSERYVMSATAVEIAAFFNQAMPSAGWAKLGTSTNTALFFRKGPVMIGVLINSSGGTFTLMGS